MNRLLADIAVGTCVFAFCAFPELVLAAGDPIVLPGSNVLLSQEASDLSSLDDLSEAAALRATRLHRASIEEASLFSLGLQQRMEGHSEQVRSLFEAFVLDHSTSPLLPEVYLILSEIYEEQRVVSRSAELMETFLSRFPNDPQRKTVQLSLSRFYFRLKDFKKVLSLWEGILDNDPAKIEAYDQLVTQYRDNKKPVRALSVLMAKREMQIATLNAALVERDIMALIRVELGEAELLTVAADFEGSFPADEALIALVRLYDQHADYFHEGIEATRFLSSFPTHRFAAEARRALVQIKDKIKSKRYLVAVVLPLSGRLRAFGTQALQGAELALEIFKEELPGASVALVIRDNEEDPSRLRESFETWLNEYQPVAVVGPMLSKEVNRLAPIVERAGLALITPGATSLRLVGLGQTVFRNAVTNRFLCNAMAEYAVLELQVERYAVLYPDEKLGRRWVDCFSKGVEKLGGEVVLSQGYPLDNTDFSRAILKLKKADLAQDGFMEDFEDEKGEVERLYTPGFEAVFLPADAVRAGLIIPQLLFHDFIDMEIIGTSSWNTPEFLKLAGEYAEGVVFADGFFSESDDPVVQKFVTRYRAKYKTEPDVFSAQAYDATRLVLSALRQGALSPAAVKTAISETIDFPGASGFIYEVIDGEVIREPFYVRVQGGAFVHVN